MSNNDGKIQSLMSSPPHGVTSMIVMKKIKVVQVRTENVRAQAGSKVRRPRDVDDHAGPCMYDGDG